MASIPAKVTNRITSGLKKFQPIIEAAKKRDINESDTVVIIANMLQEIFGYDKYTEITSEHSIKGTFVDLAIKLDGTLCYLIEVKAIGLELKDTYVKQAIDYGANQGVDWVVLTTGALWRVYKIQFAKPLDFEMVFEFNFLELNPKSDTHLEMIWMLSKEGWNKEGLKDYHTQRQALNRFVMASLLRNETVLEVMRRELKRVSPGVKIEIEEIENVLVQEVIKREVLGSADNHLARFVWSGYKANPVGGLRCVVLRSRKSNLPGFSRCYRGRPPTPVARRRTIVCLCRRCCGYCERGLRGGICRSGSGSGIRCSSDSIAGRDRGCGPNSLKRSRTRIGNG